MIRHIFATLVDALVWFVLAFGGYLLGLGLIFGDREKWMVLGFVIIEASMPVYFATELLGRRTWGKKLTAITVVLQNGQAPNRGTRILRWAVKCSPWVMSLVLISLASHIPNTPVMNNVLVGYPKAIERFVVGRAYDVVGMRWENFLYPPLFAIRFLAFGMVPMTILAAGYLLILVPPYRTLLDRLSGTKVVQVAKHAPEGFEPLPPMAGKAPAPPA